MRSAQLLALGGVGVNLPILTEIARSQAATLRSLFLALLHDDKGASRREVHNSRLGKCSGEYLRSYPWQCNGGLASFSFSACSCAESVFCCSEVGFLAQNVFGYKPWPEFLSKGCDDDFATCMELVSYAASALMVFFRTEPRW